MRSPHQLAQLLFGRVGNTQKFDAKFGGRVASGVALKERGPKDVFQRINVPVDSRAVNPKSRRSSAHRSLSCDFGSGANLVPIVHIRYAAQMRTKWSIQIL